MSQPTPHLPNLAQAIKKVCASNLAPNPTTSQPATPQNIREQIVLNPIVGATWLEEILTTNGETQAAAEIGLWRSELIHVEQRRRRFGKASEDEVRWRQLVYELLRTIGDVG